MMDAGITTVKIKCQDAVGYLAVYRYRTYRVYIGTGYLLPHGTYYVVGPVPVYKDRCFLSDIKIQILSLYFNVRGPGRAV
jgi:hypothetical protein